MKRITLIATFVAASAFAVTGCKKKDEGNKPATTEATKPAAGTATPPAAGSAVTPPAAGSAVTPPAGDPAAMPPAADPAAPGGTAAMPAGGGAVPSDAEFEALMNKTIGMVTAMADAAEKAGDDCGKLADAIDKVMADHKDFIETAKKYKGNPEMDKKAEAWMQKNTDKMMGPAMKLAGASQKCMTDPKFKAVMEKFDDLGG